MARVIMRLFSRSCSLSGFSLPNMFPITVSIFYQQTKSARLLAFAQPYVVELVGTAPYYSYSTYLLPAH
jgi:hypothetical protein